MKRDPALKLFGGLAIMPIMIIVAYHDERTDGGVGSFLVDLFTGVWQVALFVVGVLSLLVFGVSAKGRLKSGPDPETTRARPVVDISPATFIALLLYVVLFSVFYLSDAEIGGFSLANFTDLTNLLLFAMPIWFVICISVFKQEMRQDAA